MTTESMSIITPQHRQHKAIELHEKAIRHLREAARLHDVGDTRQANTHAAIANTHSTSALLMATGALNA
jgi:response regulator RpfG family c-di-GMP phosphodiesterase